MVFSARTSYTMPYPFNGFASFSALLHNSETTINLIKERLIIIDDVMPSPGQSYIIKEHKPHVEF